MVVQRFCKLDVDLALRSPLPPTLLRMPWLVGARVVVREASPEGHPAGPSWGQGTIPEEKRAPPSHSPPPTKKFWSSERFC